MLHPEHRSCVTGDSFCFLEQIWACLRHLLWFQVDFALHPRLKQGSSSRALSRGAYQHEQVGCFSSRLRGRKMYRKHAACRCNSPVLEESTEVKTDKDFALFLKPK